MTNTATIDDFWSWNPCIDRRTPRVKQILGRRKNWKWKHLLKLKYHPLLYHKEWFWLATQFLEHCELSNLLILISSDMVEAVLKKWPDQKQVAKEIKTARKHARGELSFVAASSIWKTGIGWRMCCPEYVYEIAMGIPLGWLGCIDLMIKRVELEKVLSE